jgi:hypothetical protein
MLRVNLSPTDREKYGVGAAMEFDPSSLSMRDLVNLEEATGLGMQEVGNTKEPSAKLLLAFMWIAVGRATGTLPDWKTFDLAFESLDFEDTDQGKAPPKTPSTTRTPRSRSTSGSARRTSTR